MEIPSETKVLKTPSGRHDVVVRSYITGVERRANRRFLFELKEEDRASIATIEKAEDMLLRQIVVSVDGHSEDVVERVLGMEGKDYDFIITAINDIAVGGDDKKKVTSPGSTETSSVENQ